MRPAQLFLSQIVVAVVASAQITSEPFYGGFHRNIGQYGPDILFEYENYRFRGTSIETSPDVTLEFANASPFTVVEGDHARGFKTHLYLGSNPSTWRTDVPGFGLIRYRDIYPGIDYEWHGEADAPIFRAKLSPGADPNQLVFDFRSSTLPLGVTLYAIAPVSDFFDPRAYQTDGANTQRVPARFVRVDNTSFRVEIGTFDRSKPLTVEIGRPITARFWSSSAIGSDDAIYRTGPSGCCSPFSHSALVKIAKGKVEFVTYFDGVYPARLHITRTGQISVAGSMTNRSGEIPSTSGAPVPFDAARVDNGWVGRFDSEGRLIAATGLDDRIEDMAVDTDGSVYLAAQNSIVKWQPTNNSFAFRIPVWGARSVSVNSGIVGWAAPTSPDQLTTPLALKQSYEGPEDLYVGTFEANSGRIRMATYVPAIGSPSHLISLWPTIAVSPTGALWIVSQLYFSPAYAYTLVAVQPGGTGTIVSEPALAPPFISFDPDGNALLLTSSFWPNLPTSLDAQRRAPCDSELHLRIVSPEGVTKHATYLRDKGTVVAFEGLDRVLVADGGSARRVNVTLSGTPGIGCLIHPGDRKTRTSLAVGGLTTIVGYGLGPLDEIPPRADDKGMTPTEVGGVEVLVNGVAQPLVSVQQGLVTFFLLEDMPHAPVRIQVRLNGSVVDETAANAVWYRNDFRFLTADGSGQGAAAAFNQDATPNWTKPAAGNTVVSVYGTGEIPPCSVSGEGKVEYCGPAPGLSRGVKQMDIRVAANPACGKIYVQSNPTVWISVVPNWIPSPGTVQPTCR